MRQVRPEWFNREAIESKLFAAILLLIFITSYRVSALVFRICLGSKHAWKQVQQLSYTRRPADNISWKSSTLNSHGDTLERCKDLPSIDMRGLPPLSSFLDIIYDELSKPNYSDIMNFRVTRSKYVSSHSPYWVLIIAMWPFSNPLLQQGSPQMFSKCSALKLRLKDCWWTGLESVAILIPALAQTDSKLLCHSLEVTLLN